MTNVRIVPIGLALVLATRAAQAQAIPLPVVDVHLHAMAADAQGPPPLAMCFGAAFPAYRDAAEPWPVAFMRHHKNPSCDEPIWSPETNVELRDQTLAVLERRNIIAVLSGSPARVQAWKSRAPDRIIAGFGFQLGRDDASPESLRRLVEGGALKVLAEVTNQYAGIGPSDPAFEPYLAMAEEIDLPVGIHIGTGPPGAPYLGYPEYRARLHSPLLLEEALLRHPNLRLYVMHAGWPMLDDMLAVLWTHPQVYIGVGVIVFALPEQEFYRYLRTIVEAGFGQRIMFGSDQMNWPGVIEPAIARIENAPFLSEQQKRDILYNNAARFLHFTDEEIARHHGR
jgi:hypothetical protein